jgi:hypothetical protein
MSLLIFFYPQRRTCHLSQRKKIKAFQRSFDFDILVERTESIEFEWVGDYAFRIRLQ